MTGLVAIGLMLIMIYTLVKNALVGTQLSADDKFTGQVELIIPITTRTEFYLEPWMKNLFELGQNTQVRIHILIDGHHPSLNAWQELHKQLPNVELHSFLTKPLGRPAIPWMIEQMSPKLTGDVIIIGDAELVPTEHAFLSLGKLVTEKQKAFFVLPQTHRQNILGEAVAVLNPTLALASIFGFRKIRRNISHQTLPFDSLQLTKQEIRDIKAFMLSLTDTTNLTRKPKKLPHFKDEKLNHRMVGGEY
jgi:hypothetical protein